MHTLSPSETEALGHRHAVPMSTASVYLGTSLSQGFLCSLWVTLLRCSSSKVTNTLGYAPVWRKGLLRMTVKQKCITRFRIHKTLGNTNY